MSLNIQLEDGYKQVAGNSGSTGGSILYYNTKTEFPSIGKTEKLYVDKSTGEIFTWNVGLAKYVVSGNIATAAGVSYDNTSSGLTAEVVQDAIDETVAKINDIQLFKFPNATIIGAPTINNGQVSGFSALNYMKFPFIVNMQGRPFTIDIAFTTGTDITNQQNIIDGIDHGIAFAIRSSKFIIVLGSKTGEWDISGGEKVSSVIVQPQTTYLVRISWDGSVYKFEYSTNGETYTEDATMRVTSSLSLYPTQINIGVTSGLGGIFTGIINMNYCSLTISNKVVWTGMDDVGLATRMAVDMSNIDDAGVEKVKSIIGDLPTKESLELDNVTNDKQVKGLLSGTTNGHLVTWGADGYTVDDSGAAIISTDINIEANKDNVPTAGAVKTAIETATTGMQKCLGTVNALTGLSTTAKTGEYYRVKTAWNAEDVDVHICDVLIAEKDNPERKIDGVNWSLLHNEMDTNTTYTLTQDEVDGHKLTFESSDGDSKTIIIPDNNTEYTAKADDAIQLNGTEFSHKTENGYNHIPTAGAVGNVLRNNGPGSVAWEAVDTTPTEGSDKLITSGGVKIELDKKANKTNKTFIESVDSTAHVVTVPENVTGFAAISMIGGKTVKTKNLITYPYVISGTIEDEDCKIIINDDGTIDVSAKRVTVAHVKQILRSTGNRIPLKPNTTYVINTFNELATYNTVIVFIELLPVPDAGTKTRTIYCFGKPKEFTTTSEELFADIVLEVYKGTSAFSTLRIYPALYEKTEAVDYFEPYFDGLHSVPVESVVSYGKNLIEYPYYFTNGAQSSNVTATYDSDGCITLNGTNDSSQGYFRINMYLYNDKLEKGKTYTLSFEGDDAIVGDNILLGVYTYTNDSTTLLRTIVINSNEHSITFTVADNEDRFVVYLRTLANKVFSNVTIKPMIERGSNFTEYSLANKIIVPIPQEIFDLPDYGIEGNYVDLENMKYYHNRTEYDLGLCTFTDDGQKRFATSLPNLKSASNITEIPKLIMAEYEPVSFDAMYNNASLSGVISVSTGGSLSIRRSDWQTADDVKADLNGKIVIYELATPEVIDLTSILCPFKVESGGTITLENEHNLDVPNTILYKKEVL